jgi:type IV pilus assembly protein PilC
MPTYVYKGKTKEGKIKKGSLEAPDKQKALESLQEKRILVLSISNIEQLTKVKLTIKKRLKFRIGLNDLALFARQLSTLLDAGVPLLRSLQILREQITSKPLYIALEEIIKDIEAGKSLSEALAKHPKIFSEFWTNIITTGETSGQLPFVLAQLAQYIEMALFIQRKVKTALFYPTALILFATAAVTVFITIIIPIFSKLYSSFGAQLPFLTNIIINWSLKIKEFFPLMLLLLVILIVILVKFWKTPRGEFFIDNLKLKLPILKNLFYSITLQRFSSGLAILLRGGVPIIYALEVVSKAVVNKIYEGIIIQAKEKIKDGEALANTLEGYPREFPPIITNMIRVGEESGALADMLARVSQFYREKVDTYVERLPYVLEPIIVLTIGGIVGIIVIAMFLPIFGIATAVK